MWVFIHGVLLICSFYYFFMIIYLFGWCFGFFITWLLIYEVLVSLYHFILDLWDFEFSHKISYSLKFLSF